MYVVTDLSLSVDAMLDRASIAKKSIKGNYLQSFAYYDEKLRSDVLKEQEIEADMRKALEEHQFQVYLQPKCRLDNGKIVGSEALVRWIHPEKGFMSPGMFIPVFEKNGFIMEMDAYVWEEVCINIRRWLDENPDAQPAPVSTNISRVNLYNPKLCETLVNLVKKYRIPPHLLELEITESAYADNPKLLIDVIAELKGCGFTIEMDDFGSGYSSLNMLKEVSVDVLKLDMRFLYGSDDEGRGGSILTSIVRMAHWLKLKVVAEGVETKEQASFLRSIGCPIAQGYLFYKPMPIKDFEAACRENYSTVQEENITTLSFDEIDKFWSTDSDFNILLSSVIGAIGIYEKVGETIEPLRVSDEYFRLTGSGRDAVYSSASGIRTWVYDEDWQTVCQAFDAARREGKMVSFDYRRRSEDELRWYRAKVRFLSGDEQRGHYYVSFDDISFAKQQEQLLRRIIDNLPGGITAITLKPDSHTFTPIFVSESLAKLLGYTRDELFEIMQKDIFGIVYAEDREMMYENAAARKLGKLDILRRYVKKDGTLLWLRILADARLKEDGTITVYSIHLDATELVSKDKMNTKLNVALSEATRTTQTQSEFLSRMSRDLFSPMTSILEIVQLSEKCEDTDSLKDALKKIRELGNFMTTTLSDVLDMADIERGQFALHPQILYYDDFLHIIETLFIPKCKEKKVLFHFDKGSTDLPIYIDKMRFTQVFYNILTNALKYTPEGGSIDYFVYNNVVKGNILSCDFVIRDTGCGISKDFLPFVFEPFSREANEINKNTSGAGLGLTLAKHIVDNLGGTLSVRSKQGRGTEVSLHLDMLIMSSPTAPPRTVSTASLAGKNILLVEDQPLTAEIITSLLSQRGAKVYLASTGKEALRLFARSKERHFQAMFISADIQAPTGPEIIKGISALHRSDAKNLPVIALASDAWNQNRSEMFAAGIRAVVSKPIDPDALLMALMCNLES